VDAAIIQLLTYCEADPDFFEPPWRMRDEGSLFPVSRRPVPAGWTGGPDRLWTTLRPAGATLPDQGWKIHVSATPATAADVCDRVWDFCIRHGLTAKFLRSLAAVRLLGNKYADRAGSGKLVTLYPVDDGELTAVLPALADLLRGVEGPYVLSDLRYEDSAVYVRYGAFTPMTYVAPDGDTVSAVRAPDGRLVPDARGPSFSVPEWVTVPEVLHGSLARRAAGAGVDFPYQVERPLHFSNGGGVYLARERDTGRYVVLLEARPHAGLDRDGADAVTRLARERAVLERLAGLSCVPRLLGARTVWEHHFLVEEYVEGRTLAEEVFERYPLARPDPTAEAVAEYLAWATDVVAKVDQALAAVHSRGVRHVDLHPANVIVRPDGSVVLLDFEIATDLADEAAPGLAAPGFGAPAGLSGRDADDYVLNGLRQWVLLPISPLTDRDPAKLASLTEVVTEHFPVPAAFGPRMVRKFAAGRGPLGEDAAAALFREPDWPRIRDSLAAGIAASATPERADRLYPGDPQQHSGGGVTVGNGAAGVLWALHQVGAEVPPEHLDWLAAAARRVPDPRPGLLDGLHGTAVTLDLLGRPDEAMDVLDRARKLHDGLTQPGLAAGLAGVCLSLLHAAGRTGAEDLRAEALALGDRLAAELADPGSAMLPPAGRVGLQHGLTGVALCFLRLHEATGEPRYLDLARTALTREVARGRVLDDGSFQLLDTHRYHAYLGTGSIGLALVLERYLRHRAEPGFPDVVDRARRACRAPFVRHPFLFMGRAGTIAALALLGREDDRPVLDGHVRRLGWHALTYRGHLAFPGNQLLRLSMDLSTGSAGVLAALGVAFDRNASISPLLDLRVDRAAPHPEGR
jgi:hypothetical protein